MSDDDEFAGPSNPGVADQDDEDEEQESDEDNVGEEESDEEEENDSTAKKSGTQKVAVLDASRDLHRHTDVTFKFTASLEDLNNNPGLATIRMTPETKKQFMQMEGFAVNSIALIRARSDFPISLNMRIKNINDKSGKNALTNGGGATHFTFLKNGKEIQSSQTPMVLLKNVVNSENLSFSRDYPNFNMDNLRTEGIMKIGNKSKVAIYHTVIGLYCSQKTKSVESMKNYTTLPNRELNNLLDKISEKMSEEAKNRTVSGLEIEFSRAFDDELSKTRLPNLAPKTNWLSMTERGIEENVSNEKNIAAQGTFKNTVYFTLRFEDK